MSAIALLPGVLALVVGITRGPARAFVDVYLPTLLLMPDYYRFIIAGLPDPTPNQAAILAVAALALLRRRAWSPSLLGGLVLVLCATMAYSEYRAKGYADAQNFLFDILGSMLLPYLLARALIEPSGLRVAFVKRMVQIMALQALLGLWEMRMVIPLVRRLLDPFFPGQGSWAPTGRYGFIRVSSSFGHAILAGIMFVSAYRLQRWLQWTGAWPGCLPGLGIPRARAYTALLSTSPSGFTPTSAFIVWGRGSTENWSRLRTQLNNGDIVEIFTSPGQTPSQEWLSIVGTSRARHKIRHWLNTEQKARSIELGRRLFDADMPAESIVNYQQLSRLCFKPLEAKGEVIDSLLAFVTAHTGKGAARNRDTLARMREALDGLRLTLETERTKTRNRPPK